MKKIPTTSGGKELALEQVAPLDTDLDQMLMGRAMVQGLSQALGVVAKFQMDLELLDQVVFMYPA
jgi:hypothetical protein